MADDFKPGDVAVCVDDSVCGCGCGNSPPISIGAMYRVLAVRPYRGQLGAQYSLILSGMVPMAGHSDAINAARFRKLPPASDEFTQRIRACRPVRERIPA